LERRKDNAAALRALRFAEKREFCHGGHRGHGERGSDEWRVMSGEKDGKQALASQTPPGMTVFYLFGGVAYVNFGHYGSWFDFLFSIS
jgi:hypothetical protein